MEICRFHGITIIAVAKVCNRLEIIAKFQAAVFQEGMKDPWLHRIRASLSIPLTTPLIL